MHIAVIAKTNVPKLVSKEERRFISGSWAISKQRAQDLIGGTFSAHFGQDEKSYHQGAIVDVIESQEFEGRFDIIYVWQKDNFKGSGLNWANEKAYA